MNTRERVQTTEIVQNTGELEQLARMLPRIARHTLISQPDRHPGSMLQRTAYYIELVMDSELSRWLLAYRKADSNAKYGCLRNCFDWFPGAGAVALRGRGARQISYPCTALPTGASEPVHGGPWRAWAVVD